MQSGNALYNPLHQEKSRLSGEYVRQGNTFRPAARHRCVWRHDDGHGVDCRNRGIRQYRDCSGRGGVKRLGGNCVGVFRGRLQRSEHAQLAAHHPVSGGTYEYGYRWLSPWLGFTAGWMFLCAKSASAATAVLGFAGYFLRAIDGDEVWLLPVALMTLAGLTALVLTGIRRSSIVNIVIVTVTLLSLTFFVLAGFPMAAANWKQHLPWLANTPTNGTRALLQATALMFVAYTGYGRIATLGEEVHDPARTIPRAVIATLIASMLLYVSVALIGIGAVGADAFGDATRREVAPLEVIASQFKIPGGAMILAGGAMTAMLGVLLNLLLGLSRVLLAMGRRGDMPTHFASINPRTNVPWPATIAVATLIALLVLTGDVKLTWSFSAFTVLIYYAITNWCVLRLRPEQRLFPIGLAYCGLVSCGFLAFWVDRRIWLTGIGLIICGAALARGRAPCGTSELGRNSTHSHSHPSSAPSPRTLPAIQIRGMSCSLTRFVAHSFSSTRPKSDIYTSVV